MSLMRSQGKGHRLEMFRQLTPIDAMLPRLRHSLAWLDELGRVGDVDRHRLAVFKTGNECEEQNSSEGVLVGIPPGGFEIA